MSFSSVLVANRGEIALRIMRSLRAAGLRAIAVYTDADADAPHVRYADRAVRIGAGPAGDSYLSIDRIVEAARETGASAVHPGYGFLSENAEFAAACDKAGLVFIGPSAHAIALMGNKAAAKRAMIAAGVPCVPGYEGDDRSDAALRAEAEKIGFPVMIKAAAGGGGRGMRLVEKPEDFADALRLARTEAEAAFGSDEVILERAIRRPRHVEIQIFADSHGNVVHLGERDCSVQRRHQKVVEEAPCPVMTGDLRAAMGHAAVEAAQAIGYVGAGTVEFLLEADGSFFFLEMNTRLQVEHPVTELITGRDLVDLQIAVARGETLGFAQDDVTFSGHAIEVRLYAEDPANGFLPQAGRVALWQPAGGPGIRIDDGIATGQEVSPFYDPMLAKIVAHGETRQQARTRLVAALQDSVLFGVRSNRDFLIDVLSRDRFAAGQATTDFIDREYGGDLGAGFEPGFADFALAAAVLHGTLRERAHATSALVSPELLGWSSQGVLTSRLRLDGRDFVVREARGSLTVSDGETRATVSGTGRATRIDGIRADLRASRYDGARVHLATGNRCFSFAHDRAGPAAQATGGGGNVTAPMHGVLVELFVAEGDRVGPGQKLAVLEAMKMQHELVAEVSGTVIRVAAEAGGQVHAGEGLIEIEEEG